MCQLNISYNNNNNNNNNDNNNDNNNNNNSNTNTNTNRFLKIWNKNIALAFYSKLLDFEWVCLALSFEGMHASYIVKKTCYNDAISFWPWTFCNCIILLRYIMCLRVISVLLYLSTLVLEFAHERVIFFRHKTVLTITAGVEFHMTRNEFAGVQVQRD